MDGDVRAAKIDMWDTVDKLRYAACDPNSPIYGSNMVPWIDDLTTAWLEEHPVDSELSITEAWLRSIGFETIGGRLTLGRMQMTFFEGWNTWWSFSGGQGSTRLVDDIKTRGRLLSLLTALGISPRRGAGPGREG